MNWIIKTTASCILQETLNSRTVQHFSHKSWRWDREFVPKRQCGITTLGCIIFQKSTDLKIYPVPRGAESGLTIKKTLPFKIKLEEKQTGEDDKAD